MTLKAQLVITSLVLALATLVESAPQISPPVSMSTAPPLLPTGPPNPPAGDQTTRLNDFSDIQVLSSDEVAKRVSAAERVSSIRSNLPTSRRCEDGPTNVYYAPPEDTYYYPEIYVKTCSGYCPNNGECLARKQVTRYVIVSEYKSISIGDSFTWILIGRREIKIKDDVYCKCEGCSDIQDYYRCIRTTPCPDSTVNTTFCYWRPYYDLHITSPISVSVNHSVIPPELWGSCDCCRYTQCEPGQHFDRQLCKCFCYPKPCEFPRVQDPNMCECVCPQKHDCGPLQVWDPCQCRCECRWFICKPPRYPDYDSCECQCPPMSCEPPFEPNLSSCECRCPVDISCPFGHYLDASTCECVPWFGSLDGDQHPPEPDAS